jgi:alanyl-tRNA synthetase
MALFSEKYGDKVRVVTMGTSKELCGGTHVAATGQIGIYLTSQEASVGTSVRRIEALTGTGADRFLRSRSDLVTGLAERLQTTPDLITDRVQQLQEELSSVRRQLRKVKSESGREAANRLAASPVIVRGVPLVAATVTVPDEPALREMGDSIRHQLGSGVILLAAELNGQVRFIVTVDDDLTRRGLSAGAIASRVGERMGGKGGGRPDSAQGGSKDISRLDETISDVPDLLAALLG